MASAAQAEFDELMRDKERRTAHPEDRDEEARNNNSDGNSDSDSQHPRDLDGSSDRRALGRSRRGLASDDEHIDDDDDDDDSAYTAPVRNPPSRDTIPRTRYAANTGPKGVIADAQNFRASQRAAARSAGAVREKSAGRRKADEAEDTWAATTDEAGEVDLEDDFMHEWRQARLRQLQNGVRESSSSRSRGGAAGRRGVGMATVDGLGFLEAVEGSVPEIAVVVYIYDDQSAVSDALEECLRDLAPLHPEARFVRLHYVAAEMERAGVPALLAYRGGDKFAGLVPLIHDIPDDAELDARTLEAVLKRHQILR